MRILVVGSTKVGSGDVTLLLAKAFRRQGNQIQVISVSEERPFWAKLSLILDKRRSQTSVINFSNSLYKKAQKWHPDVVFIHGSNTWLSSKVIRALKNNLDCKIVLWEVNNYCFRGHQAECIPLYDHVFTMDSYLIPILSISGAQNVHHLSACADPEEHFPVELSNDERVYYGSDICFIGRAYPERVHLLQKIKDEDLRIYGNGWSETVPNLVNMISDEPVLSLTKAKIFSASKISINIQGSHMINGENFRVFEVAACGGVSFSTHKPGLVKCFKPGKEVVIFSSSSGFLR